MMLNLENLIGETNYRNGVVLKYNNKRIALHKPKGQEGFHLTIKSLETPENAKMKTCKNVVEKGVIRNTHVGLSRETLEGLAYAILKTLENLDPKTAKTKSKN